MPASHASRQVGPEQEREYDPSRRKRAECKAKWLLRFGPAPSGLRAWRGCAHGCGQSRSTLPASDGPRVAECWCQGTAPWRVMAAPPAHCERATLCQRPRGRRRAFVNPSTSSSMRRRYSARVAKAPRFRRPRLPWAAGCPSDRSSATSKAGRSTRRSRSRAVDRVRRVDNSHLCSRRAHVVTAGDKYRRLRRCSALPACSRATVTLTTARGKLGLPKSANGSHAGPDTVFEYKTCPIGDAHNSEGQLVCSPITVIRTAVSRQENPLSTTRARPAVPGRPAGAEAVSRSAGATSFAWHLRPRGEVANVRTPNVMRKVGRRPPRP